MKWRSGMESLSPSTVNVSLSAVRRKLGRRAASDDRVGGGRWADRHPNPRAPTAAAGIEKGMLLRAVLKARKVTGESFKRLGNLERGRDLGQKDRLERFGDPRSASDLREALPQERRRSGTIKFLLAHSSIQTTERYLGSEQGIAVAVIAAANRITRPYPDERNCRSSLAQITPRLLQDDCAAEVLTATESDRVAVRQPGPYPPRSRHGRGEGEIHPEGSYFLEFWDQGKRKREAVGSDAFVAAHRATRR